MLFDFRVFTGVPSSTTCCGHVYAIYPLHLLITFLIPLSGCCYATLFSNMKNLHKSFLISSNNSGLFLNQCHITVLLAVSRHMWTHSGTPGPTLGVVIGAVSPDVILVLSQIAYILSYLGIAINSVPVWVTGFYTFDILTVGVPFSFYLDL